MLDGEQLALQIHESVGHALELDRILLGEASYAGTSWVGAGRHRLGALRLRAHERSPPTRRCPARSGSFGWDDEGVPASRYALVDGGMLRATLSNRESAAAIGLDRSGGCARADGFARQPIVRMTNVSIEPGGAGSLEDLIADTDDGMYLETQPLVVDRRPPPAVPVRAPRSAARSGAATLGRLYRNPSYAGIGPRFWGSLDAVCGPAEWRAWGLTNCGKGEPGQVMARLARRRAGALPRRPGRRRVSRARRSSIAERALGHTTGDAQVTVTRERSLLSRFARSRPTQATQVDDTTRRDPPRPRRATPAAADTNDLSDEGLRDVAARADAAARAAAARGRRAPASTPACPTPRAGRGAPTASTPRTAELDPGVAGDALRRRVRGVRANAASRRSASGRRATSRRRSRRRPASAPPSG